MAEFFVVEEHTFDGQHIREHPRALGSSQEDTIWLHAKSYTPHEVANGSSPGDLTIIAFHANAFHKEVYEPFFEALYRCLKNAHGVTVGSIWIADQANQGTSGLLNDGHHANDPSWFDHSRDILTMTNVFRKRMKRPLVAIGHSMGGTQAVATAHLHPRLFEAMVLIDATISQYHSPATEQLMAYALRRPESHETREEVEKAVRKSPLFKGWDPRVIQRYLDTGFHANPTTTLPNDKIKPTTTKHAETATLARSWLQGVDDYAETENGRQANANTQPKIAWSWLPTLRPSVLFIHGEGSRVCRPEEIDLRTQITGAGPGGSGGAAAGKVKKLAVAGGHFAPMTNVEGTAEAVGKWIGEEIRAYRRREGEELVELEGQSLAQRQRVEPAVRERWNRWDGKTNERRKENDLKSRL